MQAQDHPQSKRLWNFQKVITPSTCCIIFSPCMCTCCGLPPAHCTLHSSSNLEGNTLLSFLMCSKVKHKRGRNKQSLFSSKHSWNSRLLLLRHTNRLSLVTSSLGVLTSHLRIGKMKDSKMDATNYVWSYPKAPVVPKTPVGADLLETLKILTELVVQHVSHDLEETKRVIFQVSKRAK